MLQQRTNPCLCISCPDCKKTFMATALNKDYHNDNDANKELLNDIADYAAKGYSVSFQSPPNFKMDKCTCK